MTNGDKIRHFLTSHPSIDLSKFSRESKVGRQTIKDIQNGSEPQQRTWNKLEPVMRKYGYKGTLRDFKEFCQDNYGIAISHRLIDEFEKYGI